MSDIQAIVQNAATIPERMEQARIEHVCADEHGVNQDPAVERWLDQWRAVLGQDGHELLARRLRWSDWTIDEVRRALGSHLSAPGPLPSWAHVLMRISTEAASPSTTPPLPVDPGDPLPFEDILLPAIRVARRELMHRLTSAELGLLSECAHRQLERGLLIDLTNLCADALEHEFDRARPPGCRLLALMAGTAADPTARAYYSRFVAGLLLDGLMSFFVRWPVLARLIAQIVEQWAETAADLLSRLNADLTVIERLVGGSHSSIENSPLGKVAAIQTHLSDRHHRGGAVLAVEFQSGLKCIYKPRSLSLEAAFFNLLAWSNSQPGALHPFRILWVLDRGSYGWMEHAEASPCIDQDAVARFYERAGMLLALLYAIQGEDLHFENVIASGEHPLVIDAEALLQHDVNPQAIGGEIREGVTTGAELFRHSVLRTGFLPRWEFSGDADAGRDVSALGAEARSPAESQIRRWTAINSDSMHRALQPALQLEFTHRPALGGQFVSPDDYLHSIVAGFSSMYRLLARCQTALLADTRPLEQFRGQNSRFIFRVTQLYYDILSRSLSLPSLRSGIARSIALELLPRAFLLGDSRPPAWPILPVEQAALERLDIPYFFGSTSERTLRSDMDLAIADFFEQPSYEDVVRRIKAMGEQDLAVQVQLIRGAFHARQARPVGAVASGELVRGAPSAEIDRQKPLRVEDLLREAEAIGRDLARRVIRDTDGSATWVGLAHVSEADRYQLQPLGARLYDGSAGVALFLAALQRSTKSNEFGDLALAALQPLRHFLHAADSRATARLARDLGVGGATGLGSLAYALVLIADSLSRPDLLEDASLLAQLISDELLDRDKQLDVTGGTAGASLGLLALYARTRDPHVLERATQCGWRLLEKRVSHLGRPRAWQSIEPEPLTGFGHGAAGIAYALLRLYAATHIEEFRDAAAEAIEYERGSFDASLGNWQDLRRSGRTDNIPWYMVNWCHGAAGIGLARLGGLAMLDTPAVRQDIEASLTTTRTWGAQDVDHLCCGNAGRAELFLSAATILDRPEHRDRALRHAAWVVNRAHHEGGYRLFPNLPDQVFSPGFFQGTSGIGYLLLRLTDPRTFPSVLLWQ